MESLIREMESLFREMKDRKRNKPVLSRKTYLGHSTVMKCAWHLYRIGCSSSFGTCMHLAWEYDKRQLKQYQS